MAARQSKLAHQVYEDLLSRILTLELKPRQALSEVQVAEETGVSRSPVREAFLRLASEGFLDIVPQRGTMVAPLRTSDLQRAQFMREALEIALVRRAVAAGETANLIGPLERELALQELYAKLGDDKAFHDSDDAFHRLIAVHAGLPDVWDEIARIKRHWDRYRLLVIRQTQEPAHVIAQHKKVTEAIAAGDEAAAVERMTEHLRRIYHLLKAAEDKYPEFMEGGSVFADNDPVG